MVLVTQFTIDVGHEAVFEVNVTKPSIKGRQEGEVLIKTSLGKVQLTLSYTILSLHIIIPGASCSHILQGCTRNITG